MLIIETAGSSFFLLDGETAIWIHRKPKCKICHAKPMIPVHYEPPLSHLIIIRSVVVTKTTIHCFVLTLQDEILPATKKCQHIHETSFSQSAGRGPLLRANVNKNEQCRSCHQSEAIPHGFLIGR
jgi:hypothetical protein